MVNFPPKENDGATEGLVRGLVGGRGTAALLGIDHRPHSCRSEARRFSPQGAVMTDEAADPIPRELCDAFNAAIAAYLVWSGGEPEPQVGLDQNPFPISAICGF